MQRRLPLKLAIAALLMGGCTLAPSRQAALTPTACWFEVPDGRAATCYRFSVPESRAGNSERQLTLPVAVLSTPATRRHDDPILYVSGGPGSAVGLHADEVAGWWPYIDAVPWLQGRDLVLVDQRGAGMAEPNLDCPEIEQAGLDLLQLSSDPARRRDAYVAAAAACRQRWIGAGVSLGDYDSRAAAADFAELRNALGIAAWNIYSVSYGTRLALTLMRDHPEGLRAVILDSAYPPEAHFFETRRAAIDGALRRAFAACAADEACAAAAPDAERHFHDLVAQAIAGPRVVAFNDHTRRMREIHLTGGLLVEQAVTIITDQDALSELPALLQTWSDDNPAALSSLAAVLVDEYTAANYFSEAKYFAVDCEEEVPFTDRARLDSDRAAHPLLADYGLVTDDWAACAGWVGPDAAQNSKAPIESGIPTLVLQGEFDSITPPEFGRLAASRLRNGHLVSFPQVGHKVVDQSVCGQKIAALFLANPVVAPTDPCLQEKPERPW